MLKKLMAVVLVGLLTIGSMAMMATASAEPLTSLFSDFEEDATGGEGWAPEHWEMYGTTCTVTIDTEKTAAAVANSGLGSNCVKIDTPATGSDYHGLKSETITLKPNTTYALSAWCTAVKGAEETLTYACARITLAGTDQAAWYSNQYLTRVHKTSANIPWEQMYATYTTGDEPVQACVYLRGDQGSPVWYDNVAVYEIPEADATFPAQKIGSTATIINGSFEELTPVSNSIGQFYRPTGWNEPYAMGEIPETYPTNHAVVSTDKARTGVYSLKIQTSNTNANSSYAYRTITGLTPGKAYILKYFANVTGNTSFGASVGVRNTAETYVGWYSCINAHSLKQEKTSTNGKWVAGAHTFIAPAASVQLRINAASTSAAPVYIDDISLTEVPDAGMLDVTIYDDNANKVDKLQAGVANNVKIAVNGANPVEATKTYTLIYATYTKDGEITEMKTVSLSQKELAAKQTGQYSTSSTVDYEKPGFVHETIDVSIPAGQTLKVFVFDNMSTLNAVSVQELA